MTKSHPHSPTPSSAGTPQSIAPVPLPLRDFFRNPVEAGHRISPDGRYVSYTAPYERRMNVFVRPLAGGPVTRATSEESRDISGYFWKGNRIIFAKDFGGDENFHVVSVGIDGSDLMDLTPGEAVRADIVDILEDDDDHLILSHNRRDAEVFDVFRIHVRTGAETLIAQNPGNITSWGTDHDGKLRVAGSTDGVTTALLYRATEDEAFAPIVTTNFKESVAPLFFTFDNQRLYVASNRGRDKVALFEFDPATAREGALLAEHPEVDVESLAYSRKRRVLTTVRWVTAKTERRFLDAETEAMVRDVEAKLPGYEVEFTSASKDEDKFIVAAYSDRTRGKRYLYDKAARSLELLAEVAPWLPEDRLAPMQPVQYVARDGLVIHGYLTLPQGVAPTEPAGGREPARRPVGARHVGLQSGGAVPGEPRLCGAADELPRLGRATAAHSGRPRFASGARRCRTTSPTACSGSSRRASPTRSAWRSTAAATAATPRWRAWPSRRTSTRRVWTTWACPTCSRSCKTIPPYWKPFLAMMQEMVGDMDEGRGDAEGGLAGLPAPTASRRRC